VLGSLLTDAALRDVVKSWFDMAMLLLLLIGGQANKNFGAKSLSDWTLLT
jgi:hypothetical protein